MLQNWYLPKNWSEFRHKWIGIFICDPRTAKCDIWRQFWWKTGEIQFSLPIPSAGLLCSVKSEVHVSHKHGNVMEVRTVLMDLMRKTLPGSTSTPSTWCELLIRMDTGSKYKIFLYDDRLRVQYVHNTCTIGTIFVQYLSKLISFATFCTNLCLFRRALLGSF